MRTILRVVLVVGAVLAMAAGCSSKPAEGGPGGGSGGTGGGTGGGVGGGTGGGTGGGLGGGAGGGSGPSFCGLDAGHDFTDAGWVQIANDPGSALVGFADPSLLYPAGADAGFMTYTRSAPREAQTRLATSTDHGLTWTYVRDLNAVTPITVTTTDNSVCGATSCSGNWVHETSSIVDDATDPNPSRRYKVFLHSYFISAGDNQKYEYGSIDLLSAPDLSTTAAWTETRLFGWNSSSPQSSSGVQYNVNTDPTLSPLLGNCLILMEPGAQVRGSTIDLALGCFSYNSATSVPIEIMLLRSTDHAATWFPVGKLLDVNDGAALGGAAPWGPQVNAADLFSINGQYFLFATPNGSVQNFGSASYGYRGCVAIPFADIDAGTLERCNGAPAVVDSMTGPSGLFSGACTYREGASAAGVMIISADTTRTPPYRIFATGRPGP